MSFTYDAFISYRHTEPDKFVAENLHRELEAFKLPRSVSKGRDLPKKKIERVFRDRDELPLASNLEDPIVEALKESEYLIVICSPRLKDSAWCIKEIQTFIELHGRSKILAVLAEGEPEDSFPKELLYNEKGEMVEPLAADVRGRNKAEIKKAIKSEVLRLLAPMFNLGYDDLKQRHRERRIKRIAAVTCALGAIGIAFGIVCASAAIRINSQNIIIAEQNVRLEEQNVTLEEQKNTLAVSTAETLSKQALNLSEDGYRADATELAYEAMTEYGGVKMPETAYSEYVLTECMNIYDGAFRADCITYMTMPGVITDMKVSPAGTVILASDNIGNLTAFDSITYEKLYEINDEKNIDIFDFIDDDRFYWFSHTDGVNVCKLSDKSVVNNADYNLLTMDVKDIPDKNQLAVLTFDGVDMLDADTLNKLSSVSCREYGLFDKLIIAHTGEIYVKGHDRNQNLRCIAVPSDGTGDVSVIDFPQGFIASYCIGDDTLYVACGGEDTEAYTILTAIDTATNEKKYEKRINGIRALEMSYTKDADSKMLLLYRANESVLVNALTGEEINNYYFDHKIVKDATGPQGNFIFYTDDGYIRSISIKEPFNDLAYQGLTADDITQYEKTADTVIARKENDNRILVYGYIMNSDSYVYTGEKSEPLIESPFSDDAKKWALETGIPDASFVDGYIEAEGVYFVRYLNDTAKAFDAATLEEMAAYDDITGSRTEYYGKINDYHIIRLGTKGYILDDDFNVRAIISEFMGVTADKSAVIVSGRAEDKSLADVAIPVYTREELLTKAYKFINDK